MPRTLEDAIDEDFMTAITMAHPVAKSRLIAGIAKFAFDAGFEAGRDFQQERRGVNMPAAWERYRSDPQNMNEGD